jgi:hypothetical protein
MMLSFGVAEKLHMTLSELFQRMTFDELLGWSAYFSVKAEIEAEHIKRQQRMRR